MTTRRARLDEQIHVSNRMDRVLYPIVSLLPIDWKVRLASYLLHKRLGV